jgi:uncharacterized Ntn-hydrolase superfamily protein
VTFSIVARQGDALGVAVASKFLAVGALVPACRARVGAIASQAFANLSYGPRGLDLLASGSSARDVVQRLTSQDELREQRQVGVVDASGGAATFTGSECFDWAGGLTGDGWAAQGNILTGPGVVDALGITFGKTEGDLATRLMAALRAGDEAGGDRRGRQGAGLVVVSPGGGYGGTTDVAVDLRVDDHPDPVGELARLLDLHRLYFSKPAPEDLVDIDAALAIEMQRLLNAAGHAVKESGTYDEETAKALADFAGWENLEERVVSGARVDRHILDALRSKTS